MVHGLLGMKPTIKMVKILMMEIVNLVLHNLTLMMIQTILNNRNLIMITNPTMIVQIVRMN